VHLPGASISQAGQVTIASYNFSEGGKPSPRWSGGALVAYESNRTIEPLIHVFDAQGREAELIKFTIPGAEVVDIRGIAHGLGGMVALCGVTQDAKLRTAGYMALIHPGGIPVTIFRTDPYRPHNITVSPDGTIWTVGAEIDPVSRKPTATSAGVLRHFDASGALLASFVPQSSLPVRDVVSGLANLASSSSLVGWYQGSGRYYFEVTANSKVRQYSVMPLNQSDMISRLAVTDNGQVFVTKSTVGASSKTALYSLDRAQNAWVLVQLPGTWERPISNWLHGGSGNTLALSPTSRQVIQLFTVGPPQ